MTFALGDDEFGLAIQEVKEIIGMMPIRSLPSAPAFIKGVINLRGQVIPVFDLRLRFAMEPVSYNERTCIIVVELKSASKRVSTGVVVDSVNDVTNIRTEQLEPAPSFSFDLDSSYIQGIAKTGDGVRIILDIERIFGRKELTYLGQAA